MAAWRVYCIISTNNIHHNTQKTTVITKLASCWFFATWSTPPVYTTLVYERMKSISWHLEMWENLSNLSEWNHFSSHIISQDQFNLAPLALFPTEIYFIWWLSIHLSSTVFPWDYSKIPSAWEICIIPNPVLIWGKKSTRPQAKCPFGPWWKPS